MALASLAESAIDSRPLPSVACDPVLTGLFTPRHPEIGQYEVCTSPEPLAALARSGWTIEAAENIDPLDAFGTGGSYDRSALARLYGGTRARVARGWIQEGDRFESVILISPFPDATLTHLLPGTMVIRFILQRQHS